MTKISVIVPVYNVERYLEECLNSILAQTLKDFEVILINDGSLDNSLSICRKYENRDKRIKVFDIPNGGVSAARNLGLQNAKGDYITFVDPDDWIKFDMYEEMYEQIISSNADVCMCGYDTFKEGSDEIQSFKLLEENKLLVENEVKEYLLTKLIGPETLNADSQTIMGSVWRLLIKKNIIEENKLIFDEKIPVMEDLIFCVELFFKVKRVYISKERYYMYRLNEQSAVNIFRRNIDQLQSLVMGRLSTIIIKNNSLARYELYLENRYCNLTLNRITNETRKENNVSFLKKIKNINRLCKEERFIGNLNRIDMSKYTLKRKIFFNLIKKNSGLLIYCYFKFINVISK